MESLLSLVKSIFGIDAETLTVYQMLARSVVIYAFGIALVRIAKKRFIGKMTAFDTILAIIIGSLLSKAITDAGNFGKILAACFLLILLHWLFSLIAVYSNRFATLIKGNARIVIEDGEILWEALHKSNLSEQDLLQSLRLNAQTQDVSKVKIARLERNGDISVILKDKAD